MKSTEIVAALSQPEIEKEVTAWAVEQLREVSDSAWQAAEHISEKSGVPRDLIMLRLWAEMEKASRAGMEWRAAEARYSGHSFQSIASSIGWVGSPHVRKAFPNLDELVVAREQVQSTGEDTTIEVGDGRYTVILSPNQYDVIK